MPAASSHPCASVLLCLQHVRVRQYVGCTHTKGMRPWTGSSPALRAVSWLLLRATVLLVVLIWGVAIGGIHQLNDHLTLIVQSDDAIITNANARLKLMDDEETGLRGYLLTGNSVFLQPYTGAHQQLPCPACSRQPLSRRHSSVIAPLASAMQARALAWEHWAAGVLAHPLAGLTTTCSGDPAIERANIFSISIVPRAAAVLQRADRGKAE